MKLPNGLAVIDLLGGGPSALLAPPWRAVIQVQESGPVLLFHQRRGEVTAYVRSPGIGGKPFTWGVQRKIGGWVEGVERPASSLAEALEGVTERLAADMLRPPLNDRTH
ncbi:hypothetical protein [Aureimonas psammosilenae]|uniref:hypothetical protein n=1 Tax=Aureimonas psammosilenae TaxID=2495496 RepID=UPI0012604E67|nr:hypothetical protein [Aureimonas psammosilenae]